MTPERIKELRELLLNNRVSGWVGPFHPSNVLCECLDEIEISRAKGAVEERARIIQMIEASEDGDLDFILFKLRGEQ